MMEIYLENIQGEEREGFYVQPLMKRRWAVELDILREIDTICKRHQIRYFSWYGTCLGAVRHRGFIPWDDDIDLAMLREDYERFQFYFQKESPEGWKMGQGQPTMVTIVNTDKIRVDQGFLDRYHGYSFVAGVDIFSLDPVPVQKSDELVWRDWFIRACNLWKSFADGTCGDEEWGNLKELEDLTGYHFDMDGSIEGQLCTLTDRIAAMYWDTDYHEVARLPELCEQDSYRIPISCFDRVLELPFEDMTIPVLEDYDWICRLSYGDDYMTPVKEFLHEEGIKEQIEQLQERFRERGSELPECFRMTFE